MEKITHVFVMKYVFFLMALSLSTHAFSEVREYELKAAFMEKFTRFVEWPSDSIGTFYLCVIGKNLFKGELKKLENLPINGKPTLLIQMSRSDSVVGCDMLFIEESKHKDLAEILTLLENRSVLTIGDTPGFAEQGVMINFIRQNNKLRFEINQQAAEAVGLKISSRLLKLSIIISSSNQEAK